MDDGKLRQSDDQLKRIERSGAYVTQDEITITTNEIVWATDVRVRRSLSAIFVSCLIKRFKAGTLKSFSAIARE